MAEGKGQGFATTVRELRAMITPQKFEALLQALPPETAQHVMHPPLSISWLPIEHFLTVLALLSANVGLLNLMPIPLLDGGQLLFLGLEATRRRPLSPLVRDRAAWIGVAILAALFLLALRNDSVRFLLTPPPT